MIVKESVERNYRFGKDLRWKKEDWKESWLK